MAKYSNLISLRSVIAEFEKVLREEMEAEIKKRTEDIVRDVQSKYVARALDAISCTVNQQQALGAIEVQYTIRDLRDESKQ